jgi:hypothetical protein
MADANIDGSDRFQLPADVRSRRVGDETVILHLDSEQYFGLDGVGTHLWQLLSEGVTLRTAVDVISARYEVPADVVDADCRAVLIELAERGLVEAVQREDRA